MRQVRRPAQHGRAEPVRLPRRLRPRPRLPGRRHPRQRAGARTIPVKDVGPWNVDDNYWAGPGSPRPRRLFTDLPRGRARGPGRLLQRLQHLAQLQGPRRHRPAAGPTGPTSSAGACSTPPASTCPSAAASQLGLGNLQNEWVTVAFLWSPIRANVTSVKSGLLFDISGGSTNNGAAAHPVARQRRRQPAVAVRADHVRRLPRRLGQERQGARRTERVHGQRRAADPVDVARRAQPALAVRVGRGR